MESSKNFNFDNSPNLKHLYQITSKIGLYQHCQYDKPDERFGYSIDDNARAIIVCYMIKDLYHDKKMDKLIRIYFEFIKRAQLKSGHFHNFADRDGNYIDKQGSQDSQGRTLWALGYMVGQAKQNPSLAEEAKAVMKKFRFGFTALKYSRTQAFAMLGYYYGGDKKRVKKLADKLVERYNQNESENWHWFDPELTYSNGIMPYSMLKAYEMTNNIEYKRIALESLSFLRNKCVINGLPAPIGQKGWFYRGGKKAKYDQQVVDAADMILALTAAWQITKEEKYFDKTWKWWNWFWGNNINSKPFIDPKSGGCYDGLIKGGFNLNQGAESIVCYLLSYLSMSYIIKKDS